MGGGQKLKSAIRERTLSYTFCMESIWLICSRWDILSLCIRHHISARCTAETLKRGCILISSLYKSAQRAITVNEDTPLLRKTFAFTLLTTNCMESTPKS